MIDNAQKLGAPCICFHRACPLRVIAASVPQRPYPVRWRAGKLTVMAIVKTGADMLMLENFDALRGRRLGFVGNHTSRLADGTPTYAMIASSPQTQLLRLFSPEHGAYGTLDHEEIPDDIDLLTGLPIHSLYGENRKPAAEMLSGLDALVFELQDVGARFYTYASTMLLCLEACSEANIELIVLDRPNPITGTRIEGPLPDADKLSFTCCYDIPVRHGLTLGELARLVARERAMEPALRVIACQGWRRTMWWDETRIDWINPSPAMRSLETAVIYPGACLLEQTNISVGRGTSAPFLHIGAPWIIGIRWARYINEHAGPGVKAVPESFTPQFGKFAGMPCGGVRLRVMDRSVVHSVRLGLAMIAGLLEMWPGRFEIDGVNKLLACDAAMESLRSPSGSDPPVQTSDLDVYCSRIAPILLYD